MEIAKTFREWDDLVKKIADFKNHRRFMLRCIKVGITPVSCRLKTSIRTSKSYQTIKKSKRTIVE